jgi:hypothetical protein
MKNEDFFYLIIDQYKYPIVFVDNDHVIKYLNQVAIKNYQKRGFNDLLNKSIFDCHNPLTKEKIIEYHKRFINGENEIYLTTNKINQKVYMVAVRNDRNELLGYYERFEDKNN